MQINKKYQVIYADPPWYYNSKKPTTAKRPSAMGVSLTPDYYYKVMPLEEIKKLPIQEISDDDCVGFLWAKECTAQLISIGDVRVR